MTTTLKFVILLDAGDNNCDHQCIINSKTTARRKESYTRMTGLAVPVLLLWRVVAVSGSPGIVIDTFVPWKPVSIDDFFFIQGDDVSLQRRAAPARREKPSPKWDQWSHVVPASSNPDLYFGKHKPAKSAWQDLVKIPNNPDFTKDVNPMLAWLVDPSDTTVPSSTAWTSISWTTTYNSVDSQSGFMTSRQIALVLGNWSEIGKTLPSPSTFSPFGDCFCSFAVIGNSVNTTCKIVQQGRLNE